MTIKVILKCIWNNDINLCTPKDGPASYIKLMLLGQMREVISNVRAGNTILSQSTLIINRPNKTSINKPQSSCSL